MVFSSLTFLFGFLPLVLICYFIIPNLTYRNLVLLVFSLAFYAWGEPKYIILMLISIIGNYVLALFVDFYNKKGNQKLKVLFFLLDVLLNLGFLGYFKYTDFMIGNINALFGSNIPLMKIALPIGISFYTFQIFSYVIDVYKGSVKVQKNPLTLGTYIALFPQLIAGPIVRYETVEEELSNRKETFHDFAEGIRRFLIGLGKKVIISNQVGLIADTIFALEGESLGLSLAWVGILAYTFQIYFDFSGYSDMAIGLGRMFGFNFLENFNYPYIANSITDFWRRWHISLSTWFRDYVYIPLGGNRVSKLRWYFNIFAVWFLTGMWHGATWNYILWGLYFCVILVLEKMFLLKVLNKCPGVLRHIYALLLIIFGWVIFRCEDLTQISYYLNALLGANGNNTIRAFYNISVAHLWPYLVLAAIGSTPLMGKILKWMNKNAFTGILYDLFLLGVFFVSVMFLVNNSFNPFIYFRF